MLIALSIVPTAEQLVDTEISAELVSSDKFRLCVYRWAVANKYKYSIWANLRDETSPKDQVRSNREKNISLV